MKAILIPVLGADDLPAVLPTALLAGRRFGSYLEGLELYPARPEQLVPAGLVNGLLFDSFEEKQREYRRRAQERFTVYMRGEGVPAAVAEAQDAAANGVVARWRDDVLLSSDLIGAYGRLFDLLVLAQPSGHGAGGRMALLETALFESGRPILIAPPEPPASLGRVAVIAWNGSTETARTLGFAIPFLRQAERVVVLTVADARCRMRRAPAGSCTTSPATASRPRRPMSPPIAAASARPCSKRPRASAPIS